MQDVDIVVEDNIASEFIRCTCQVLPKLYDAVSDRIYTKDSGPGQKAKLYVMSCGSSAEFYIRPLNPVIDDLDRLLWFADSLAFTGDCPMLPNDMSRLHDSIKCHKIEPCLSNPGFVRLRVLGELNYNWKYKKYGFRQATLPNEYVEFNIFDVAFPNEFVKIVIVDNETSWPTTPTRRGPSIRWQADPRNFKIDSVYSMWCPQWPNEAKGWPKRPRDYGWPTTNTISEVVQNGCHVVYVQHRACRNDMQQWRLSFSVAEIILLQSWTQVQQIVYHLLRFFANEELIKKDCPKKDEIICTYHLKTLMLWTCEEMSPEWWNSSSVIVICCEMLRKLSEWLKRRHCPNYFIPEANLFHESSSPTLLQKIEKRLVDICNDDKLCLWLLEMYIKPVVGQVQIGLFYFVESMLKTRTYLVDFMLRIIEFRKEKTIYSFNILFEFMFACYSGHVLYSGKQYGQICCLGAIRSERNFKLIQHGTMTILPLPGNVSCFRYIDITLCSLHARNGLCCGKMSWNDELFVEYIKGICFKPKLVRCQYHNFPEPSTAARSQLQFLLAQDFMENLTGLNSPSEYNILSFMSKEFFRRALECDDSQSNIIAPAALVYLAALHFASSESQMVIDFCSAVSLDETPHMENETLNAGCLFFIDDVVRIVGFYLLYQKFCEYFLKRQIYLDLRLTPKVFAYYLTAKIAKKMSKLSELNPYLPTSTFLFDQFLLALTKRKFSTSMKLSIYLKSVRQCVYKRMNALIAIETLRMNLMRAEANLVGNLTEYAFENMTLFYSALRKQFGIQSNTVDCYRALYLYKCRKYDEVFHICERILQKPGWENDLKELVFANVCVLPPFDPFFDIDVKSLLGFNTLYCYLSPPKCDIGSSIFNSDFFSRFVFSVKDNLSCSYGLYDPIKCHYSLGRHFIARYLKVRCCIDCDHPYAEAMKEFAAIKIIFPFEHIIRRFVLRTFSKFRCRPNPRVLSY